MCCMCTDFFHGCRLLLTTRTCVLEHNLRGAGLDRVIGCGARRSPVYLACDWSTETTAPLLCLWLAAARVAQNATLYGACDEPDGPEKRRRLFDVFTPIKTRRERQVSRSGGTNGDREMFANYSGSARRQSGSRFAVIWGWYRGCLLCSGRSSCEGASSCLSVRQKKTPKTRYYFFLTWSWAGGRPIIDSGAGHGGKWDIIIFILYFIRGCRGRQLANTTHHTFELNNLYLNLLLCQQSMLSIICHHVSSSLHVGALASALMCV